MQTEFIRLNLPRTKPTLALESCADFFDRDYLSLVADVENGVIKFSWDIALVQGEGQTPCIRIFAQSAWAFCYNQPMPALTEDAVYQLILPNRDIRSTELKRILACSSDHVHNVKPLLVVTREPRAADGPNSFTVFSRESIVSFLRNRRLS